MKTKQNCDFDIFYIDQPKCKSILLNLMFKKQPCPQCCLLPDACANFSHTTFISTGLSLQHELLHLMHASF